MPKFLTPIIDKDNVVVAGGGGGFAVPRPKRTGATYYDVPGMSLRGWGTATYESSRVYYFPMFPTAAISVTEIAFRVTTAVVSGGATAGRVAIYTANTFWQPVTRVAHVVGIAMDTVGVKTAAVSVTLQAVPHVLAFWSTQNVGLFLRYADSATVLRVGLDEYDLLRSWKVFRDAAFNTTWVTPGVAWDDGDNTNNSFEMPLYVNVV